MHKTSTRKPTTRYASGTKVRIAWIGPSGRKGYTMRWWNQVDALIAEYRDAGCTAFRVKGQGWKDWQRA